jgi:signal transduction histidine kinase/response regulator RpfG family c-di-GMP phosphodiesterase
MSVLQATSPADAARGRPSRVLLLAPVGRDAEVTAEILGKGDFQTTICEDVDALCRGLEEGAGLVLMTAEALTTDSMARVAAVLDAQPPWSEIPFTILVAQADTARTTSSFDPLGDRAHITLVDRPIHVKTLLSVCDAAVRSRMRQYDIRDLLHQLEDRVTEREHLLARERRHAERLAGLAQASLAIASSVSLDDALQMITDEACRIINGHLAMTAIRIEENGRTRTIRAMSCGTNTVGWNPETVDADLLFDALSSDTRTSIRLSSDDLRAHPLASVINIDGLHSALLSPLQERAGVTIGVIALASQYRNAFNDDDEAVLTQLAHMASAAIQNARLYREAQAANQAKDDFLATLAHELRTPMTGILGWIQMLKYEQSHQEDVDTAIQMIESSTRIQVRLVEDLLDVSRIIAGKLRIDVGPVELAPLVDTVVETFRARAAESNVELASNVDPHPLSVLGDETRLHQIVWNLLSNAIKFTPEGGRVEIALTRSDSKAVIRITDSGQGISPEFLPHVFDRFQQADNSTTRREAGLGLGLAIVRYLTELHHGTVEASSEGTGKGATFTITLPLLAVVVDHDKIPERRAMDAVPVLDGIKVLVVDDDLPSGDLVASVLRDFGAESVAVTSVREAVKTLRRFQADIIVSDIAMPGEDGYALMQRLRELQPTLGHEVRAMALTGYGRPDDRRRILASGFQWYLQKPVDAIELGHAIQELVQTNGRPER